MKPSFILGALFLTLFAVPAQADGLKQCSTEKVNHEDCVVVIDRRYPITLPTIQMSPGKKVIVVVEDPMVFETLSLDLTGATALPGTDQIAALVTAAIPNLKGFTGGTISNPPQALTTPFMFLAKDQTDPCAATTYDKDACEEKHRIEDILDKLKVLDGMLASAEKAAPDDKSPLFLHIRVVYAQLNQILMPVPKPGSKSGPDFQPPSIAPGTPNPWQDYANWRYWTLCELVGGTIDTRSCRTDPDSVPPTAPTFSNVLGEITKIRNQLPATPPAPAPEDPIFDQSTFTALMKQVAKQIDKLDATDKKNPSDDLKQLRIRQDNLNSRLAVLGATLTSVQKDFLTYYQNIVLAKDTPPPAHCDAFSGKVVVPCLGTIYDPRSPEGNLAAYKSILGRQVIFAVNAVNNISTPVDSVVANSAKTSISTVTVLYADPHLEASAGAAVSFVHNRSFSNQTITSPPPGSGYMPGDIVIFQNKNSPEVVPFVAAHYRIGPEFAPNWLGSRRVAFYGTIWLGLNPYSTLPEYGGGPTFSWRSLMFSALYNRAHENELTSGLTVGQVVCSPSAAPGASPPPCNPAPPAPTTHMRAINAFAIGLSVRIPTSFAAGTGGVSR